VADDRDMTISCRGTASVTAAPMLLRRALVNLVSNAVKYASPGGAIIIAMEEAEGSTRISVSDNGYGIPAEHLPRVFDRFYRVDSARSHDPGGSGLGLSIVKSIVEFHGGEVTIASRLKDETTVTLIFPEAGARADETNPLPAIDTEHGRQGSEPIANAVPRAQAGNLRTRDHHIDVRLG
jgi:signal transduction histidine kinase